MTARRRRRRHLTVQEHVQGVLDAHIPTLARTITLIESSRPQDRDKAQQVLGTLLPHTGNAHRVGITGVPGVGKSTFIEALGEDLTQNGHRVAVLAIDPSSVRTGGSILGDKTRMNRLSQNPNAFIRPSPTSGTLGGVARRTREAMLLCEAAGFDVILIETVGVGQSETVVAGMTDFFLVLMLAGAGDELQGIKRGLMELADMLVINKADGDNAAAAQRAATTYRSALRHLHPKNTPWLPPVLTASALHNLNIDAVWQEITTHHTQSTANGTLDTRRSDQNLHWMWSLIHDTLQDRIRQNPLIPQLETQVRQRTLTASAAARLALGDLTSLRE